MWQNLLGHCAVFTKVSEEFAPHYLAEIRHDMRQTTELLLFLVVYVFTQRASTGQAPIEVIVPEARRMPLYRCINDPFRALQERGDVKRGAEMADLLRPQEAAAE